MKTVSMDFAIKVAGIVFAAGMAYANLTSSIEQNARDIAANRQQLAQQLGEISRINDYLAARQRNGL